MTGSLAGGGVGPVLRHLALPYVLPSIVAAAEAAGAAILAVRAEGVEQLTKSDGSPVTNADYAAEIAVFAGIADFALGDPIISEEAVAAGKIPEIGADGRFWLIDPLDGTRGFLKGSDSFTVNIALLENGRPTLGVLHAPALGETYAGAVGHGAYMRRTSVGGSGSGGWTPIMTRERPQDGGHAIVSMQHDDPAAIADWCRAHGFTDAEKVPSALKFGRLAAGLADVYPRLGPTGEWDTAAGQAILEAAGGVVLGADGARLGYNKPGFLNADGFVAWGRAPR